MNKNILIVCVLILVAGGIYAMYGDNPSFRMNQLPGYAADQAAPSSGTPTSGAGAEKHSVTWEFESAGEDENGMPWTTVTVTWDGKRHDAGKYMGSCAEIDGTNGTLVDGQVSGALCWYAGAGDEIGVFKENGAFVLKHGEQQEPSAESQGFRGNFTTLLTL